MLDSMRGLADSVVSKALMVFLVLTFVVWGIGDTLRNRSSSYLVQVGDDSVSPGQFMAQQRSMQRALEQMGVAQVDPHALQGEILRQVIQQKLITAWQHDTGLRVGRDALSQAIAASPEFKGKDGKFDAKLFTTGISQRPGGEAGYLDDLAHEIGGKAMLAAIDSSDITAPASFTALSAAAGTQTRDVVLITVPAASVDVGAVSDKDAKDFYDLHKDDFTQPETRTLEYVVLDGTSLQAKAKAAVTDKDQAEAQREQALQDLSMNIEDALAGGKSIGEAVASVGIASTSNVLKDVQADAFAGSKPTLQTDVVKQGFALGQGESSNLQSTPDGTYYMVNVKAITPAAPKPYEQVAAEVKKQVAKEQSYDLTQQRVEAAKQALAGNKDWHAAAEAAHGHAEEIKGVGRPGKEASGGPLAAALQQAVFDHAVGEIAGPSSAANGEAQLALVTGIHTTPSAVTEKTRAAAQAEYQSQLGHAVSSNQLRDIAKHHPVRVNQEMLQQLQGDGSHE